MAGQPFLWLFGKAAEVSVLLGGLFRRFSRKRRRTVDGNFDILSV